MVKATVSSADLRCGGQPMGPMDAERDPGATPAAGFDDGTLMGKRYVDADDTIEILCTKPGDGTLSMGDQALVLKEAKPLPSSD